MKRRSWVKMMRSFSRPAQGVGADGAVAADQSFLPDLRGLGADESALRNRQRRGTGQMTCRKEDAHGADALVYDVEEVLCSHNRFIGFAANAETMAGRAADELSVPGQSRTSSPCLRLIWYVPGEIICSLKAWSPSQSDFTGQVWPHAAGFASQAFDAHPLGLAGTAFGRDEEGPLGAQVMKLEVLPSRRNGGEDANRPGFLLRRIAPTLEIMSWMILAAARVDSMQGLSYQRPFG